jgi:hypothetical protein
MASSEGRKPNYSRRFFWLAVFIVLLFGGYSIAWFYAAGKLETYTSAALAAFNRDGRSADCAKPTARGFPFRIGLFCDSVSFEDSRAGVTASAAAFRSAAQVYNPFHIVGELDSPAAITAPKLGELGLNWDLLHASVVLATDFPDRISAEVEKLAVEGQAGMSAANLLSASHAEGHMRRNGPDLDLAGNFADAAIDPSLTKGIALPPITGEADLTIKDGLKLVRAANKSLRGHAGTIRTLKLSLDPTTGLSVTGPFSVSDNGLLDADFTVTIRNPKALATRIGEIFPERADQIRSAFLGLAMLGDNPTLPLKVERGKAKLGFISLGKIPPL